MAHNHVATTLRAALIVSLSVACAAARHASKPRVVVLTDVGRYTTSVEEQKDRDDQQSLVRLLVHANEVEIQGLVATSAWYGLISDRHMGVVYPESIHAAIGAYAHAFTSLSAHAPGFPAPDALHAVVKAGRNSSQTPYMSGPFLANDVGQGKSTDASNHIIDVLLSADPRPVWFLAWGKVIDLGQALFDMVHTRPVSDTALEAAVAKVHVYDIRGQDDVGAWIAATFPAVTYLRSHDMYQGVTQSGNQALFNEGFVKKHVWGHSPLGDYYPSTFLSHAVAEGDTPSLLYVLSERFGLSSTAHPSWESWGGKFTPHPKPNIGLGRRAQRPFLMYADDCSTCHPRPGGFRGASRKIQDFVAEWRAPFQNEFQARMDWCIQPPDKANHAPIAVVNGDTSWQPVTMTVAAGATVTLDATGSCDPDANQGVTTTWRRLWRSSRPPQPTPGVLIDSDEGTTTQVTVPIAAAIDSEFHVLLTVQDDGTPPLTRYRRVVLVVA